MGNCIIDVALHHFSVEFGVVVPSVAVSHKFRLPTQVISRLDLNENERLWWYLPPVAPGIDLNIPDEPPELIASYAAKLVAQLSTLGVTTLDALPLAQQPGSARFLS